MTGFPSVIEIPAGPYSITELRRHDAAAIAAAFEDPEIRAWLPLPNPYPLELAERWCVEITPRMREDDTGLVLAVRDGERLLASVDAKRIDRRAATCELSYWTAPPARGRGVMTSAVSAVARWLISSQRFERVEARVAPGNAASLAVVERAGFVREGVARNAGFTDSGRVDLVVWSLTPDDLEPTA